MGPATQVSALASAASIDGRLLEAAIEASHVCVTVSDMTVPDAPLCYVNQAFLEVSGYGRDEVLGRNCRFLQGPDTDPASVAATRAAIKAGDPLRIDLLNYRKSGAPFWNALHLSPVRSDSGDLIAYIGVQHDVTEVRAAREAEQHRQRIEALGRMAGGLAHELNNMLQPLLTLPELVAESLPHDAGEARADLQLMQNSAREARDLTLDMLGYARVAQEEAGIDDAGQAVARALALIERSLHGEVSVRTVVLADDLAIPRLSQAALQQILTNLVLNAAHAMERRGEVTVSLSRNADGGARLMVADNGCGMDDTTRARLFEPFFTTKPPGAGAGLGLHLVFDLVRHAGGHIHVESAPGEGARFILDFPPGSRD
jgi:PAS domain S-box-containing protein